MYTIYSANVEWTSMDRDPSVRSPIRNKVLIVLR